MSQAKEVWGLSLSAYPPGNCITCIEIFSREFEIFLKFIDSGFLFPEILSHEGWLRQACWASDWTNVARKK